MDVLLIVLAVAVVGLGLVTALAGGGRGRPIDRRTGNWSKARSAGAREAELEAEDLAQLLAATNVRRRARGLPERSHDDVLREFDVRL